MDSVVPAEITAELTQILSNLVQGDNDIRQNAEQAVNERLAQTPELYLLALAQFAILAELDVMRSFSLVLLRRLLFRLAPAAAANPHQPRLTLYDHLSSNTLSTLQRLLLHSLSHERAPDVRKKAVDTITDLSKQEMARGRPWHALQLQAFAIAQVQVAEHGVPPGALRESAFRIFAGCPNLVLDLHADGVLGVFQKGLQDTESVDVRHAALLAAVEYLSAADSQQLARSLSLMYPMLETVHLLSQSLSQPSTTTKTVYQHITQFLTTLTPLCTSHPTLFAPHLQLILSFLPQLILPAVDSGPTPTAVVPFPSSASKQSAFEFPPPSAPTTHEPEIDDEAEARSTMRLTALEFMISLSEARPTMVRKNDNWVGVIVRACLEGMGELDEDEDINVWLKEDPSVQSSAADDSPPSLYEQSLDRIACALGGRAVLPPAFQQIPSMLASYDWRARHAGLIAVASIAEGTGKVMMNELGKIVDLVTPMFRDTHPRVRHAACQCVGQLCTDLEEVMQERYHQQLFTVLIPTLEDPEPRVHSHAAAALINFCEGVEHDTLIPYLDPIVERLLQLLNPGGDESLVKRYVQEQAITTLAMVADASEATFAKHYPTIMPLLLNVLRNADKPEHQKLRIKAMECAGLVAIAVGRDIFRPDSATLVELLIRIQKSPVDPNDTQLGYYLISTWAKIGQALGEEFDPYLPLVMPNILKTASAKTDISVYEDDDDDSNTEREGWETVTVDGRTMGIKTSALEEKCQAFETLLIYCSTLGGKYAAYLSQTLEICIPCLKFDFHEGVREASAMLVPRLLDSGKISNTLTTQMVTATFNQLISCIRSEPDSSFLASLYKCFTESLQVIGGPTNLPQEYHIGIIDATKHQLQALADKRRSRANRLAGDPDIDREDIALYEQFEEFELQEMDKLLKDLDRNHPLRIAVSSVRELGVNEWDVEEGEETG
ncbi:hypothetical protein AGABI2DRAFT_220702 [Agaricus bisporus var. bisporus H97]|uniref:hypothetical protein n=1 Tax=Agaricus bisporus var. bisporus (strain H97 / ATCC MYA-4626 / FGSC 10389) TaxID=936046 RepID=UPI00029F616F|nr:hypothetical protein AGABI2DRAFT_220702 [Agaricus bisporus var. bisporus H97]EKV48756.1 hypothetical protein AGABI2DRAFT_220702 [Agaricus bisporus var. bisporus H97]